MRRSKATATSFPPIERATNATYSLPLLAFATATMAVLRVAASTLVAVAVAVVVAVPASRAFRLPPSPPSSSSSPSSRTAIARCRPRESCVGGQKMSPSSSYDSHHRMHRSGDDADVGDRRDSHRRRRPSHPERRRHRRLRMSSVPPPPDERVDDPPGIETSSTTITTTTGDVLRSATGIRPSLHPTVINCISEALSLRSRSILSRGGSAGGRTNGANDDDDDDNDDDGGVQIDVGDPSNAPLSVAIAAGDIAMASIERRKQACRSDGDVDGIFTEDESGTVSGRVVGVVMRMRSLECELARRVDVGWVKKYDEYHGFGVLALECASMSTSTSTSTTEDGGGGRGTMDNGGGDGGGEVGGGTSSLSIEVTLAKKIRTDPLFRMNRAEMLLALFLSTVEGPRMETLGIDVPGGSDVDFVDDDRLGVLLPPGVSSNSVS